MELAELMDGLRAELGVARVETLPDDLLQEIRAEEATVVAAGNMPVINSGLWEICERNTHLVLFTDPVFDIRQHNRSMNMVDEHGNVVGHDLCIEEIPEYTKRSDVVFISDNFVIYPGADMSGMMFMEMLPRPYFGSGDWIPGPSRPVMWYPSTTSSDMIYRRFTQPRGDLAAGILGLDL